MGDELRALRRRQREQNKPSRWRVILRYLARFID
jgi:hypothetical protein